MRAIIYCRLSLKKPREELTEAALERQEDACRALCEQRGYEVVRVLDDEGLSAYSGKARPAFEAALNALIEREADVLVVYRMDRLVRNLHDLLRVEKVLEASGTDLISVHDSWANTLEPTGRYMMRSMASLAELESSNISQRLRAQRKQAAEQGKAHPGPRPYGYVDSSRQVVN